jgi:hypothetical protein
MPLEELTPEDWQYISVLIAEDIRKSNAQNLPVTAQRYKRVWFKIQYKCEWDHE